MKKKHILIACWAVCIIFAILVVVQYKIKHDGPEIVIKKTEFNYSAKTKKAALLKICEAVDRQDDKIEVQIESVQRLKKKCARVIFFAMDKDYNISKKEVFLVNGKVLESLDEVPELELGSTEEEKTTAKVEQDEPSLNEKLLEASDYEEALEIMQEEDSDFESGSPILILTTDQHTLNAGSDWNEVSQIKDVLDDQDDLWDRIQISTEHDTDAAGEYTVEYWVTDSDGNRSNTAQLKLIVE